MDDLVKTLRSINRQQCVPDEVIIVDASAIEVDVVGVAECDELRLRYFHTSEGGLTKQRNIGIDKASGDIVIYLDDDVDLTPNCIGHFIEAFEKQPTDTVAVCGRVLNVKPELKSKKQHLFYLLDKLVQKIFLMPEEADRGYFKLSTASVRPHLSDEGGFTQVLSGGCCGYRREVFELLRFDEHFSTYAYAEDVEFSRRISNAGFKIYYEPKASLFHYPSGIARISRSAGAKMLVANMFYIYRVGFPAGPVRLLALFWCFAGFGLSAVLHRDVEAFKGLSGGIFAVLGKLQARDITPSPKVNKWVSSTC